MGETFSQYLEKWLKHSTIQGLNNPLVKMPILRFKILQPAEYQSIANGGSLLIGTNSDPISRNLYKNYQTRIRERGEHCSYMCFGSIEIIIIGAEGQQPRTALFPVGLKRVSLELTGDKIKVNVSDEEQWQINPVLKVYLQPLGIKFANDFTDDPQKDTNWIKAQLGNRASLVKTDCYIGLFSSQQMVLQQRLTEPAYRQALAHNPVIQAKIGNNKVPSINLGEITDDGLEELGMVLPCDDHQLRVVQLSNENLCLQVEGPPGTGKSQTIANIISNALFHGRRVLLVCDKKAAIVQVEERLTNCGIKPALLNLHDEDLDKREFLKQATDRFPNRSSFAASTIPANFPFDQLRDNRAVLNERVKFGRELVHPALSVTKQQAMAGLIKLRKELHNVPNIEIRNWQSLSKERLSKLLNAILEWPDLKEVLSNSTNFWNNIRPDSFDDNPNAINDIRKLIEDILNNIDSLVEMKEKCATVGIELPIKSEQDVKDILTLVNLVIKKPQCNPMIIGNSQIDLQELNTLQKEWGKRQDILAARHPVFLEEQYGDDDIKEADILLNTEDCYTWSDLSERTRYYSSRVSYVNQIQNEYRRLCEQIGIIYSPLLKVRKAQFQAILSLGKFGGLIPSAWWNNSTNPVLAIEGWKGKIRECIGYQKTAPVPLHFIQLERITIEHWQHIEIMAEYGFTFISKLKRFTNNRKCKYALKQAYPDIPTHGFNKWTEIIFHADSSRKMMKELRESSDIHFTLKQLAENYFAVAHETNIDFNQFIEKEEITRLAGIAVLVEQWRVRSDLFATSNIHWQTFWETPNQNILKHAQDLLDELDKLNLPEKCPDNVEDALEFLEQSGKRIEDFLKQYQKQDGDMSRHVLNSFEAQKAFTRCTENLAPLVKYLGLQGGNNTIPNWEELNNIIKWRDSFEKLLGNQKLDIDNLLWQKLKNQIEEYRNSIIANCIKLCTFFEILPGTFDEYESFRIILMQISEELPRHPLWLEKKRWQNKLSAYPELLALWNKLVTDDVQPDHAKQLFCFNLLRLCSPIAEPHGPELKQTVNNFIQQDEKLASWIGEHIKLRLNQSLQKANQDFTAQESELQRLVGLQRIRRTTRELLNANIEYLLAAKPCWMMSPTSLANLIDSQIFDRGIPFDMVVFDEASQIRVLDGLLSMTFGKQVIIVGDKHQLPPTDFFSSFMSLDTEIESQDFGVSESLLEEFGGVFEEDKTHVMLMSHYRSETPDLIRFSNDWFYSKEQGIPGTGRLEMYPPAHISGIGRRLHHVPNATYSETAGQRNNPIEAREVIKLIELHVRECPNKSLGVVTMNIPQMELIDELLRSTPQIVQNFCSNDSQFFLRNLETVQGDEMDRIILSLTYGKNLAGQFSATVLGPLTKSGGERRLNVAITRSRNGMTVVSSLKAADLATSGAQSNGFKCLKAFLTDLESMQQVRNYGITTKRFKKIDDGISNIVFCESPFEEQVVEFLENEGFEVECQYGDGRYRLDIVVKEKGKNILAIECDGACYHSSLVARTRDRARQSILKDRGWNIYRVWSTNWWFFEDMEKQALLDAINAARNTKISKTGEERTRTFVKEAASPISMNVEQKTEDEAITKNTITDSIITKAQYNMEHNPQNTIPKINESSMRYGDTIDYGKTFTLENGDLAGSYTLVGPEVAKNPRMITDGSTKISSNSLIGKLVLGKRSGEVFEVAVDGKNQLVKIKDVKQGIVREAKPDTLI
jgi:very-short-patch-repair endonuclease